MTLFFLQGAKGKPGVQGSEGGKGEKVRTILPPFSCRTTNNFYRPNVSNVKINCCVAVIADGRLSFSCDHNSSMVLQRIKFCILYLNLEGLDGYNDN